MKEMKPIFSTIKNFPCILFPFILLIFCNIIVFPYNILLIICNIILFILCYIILFPSFILYIFCDIILYLFQCCEIVLLKTKRP